MSRRTRQSEVRPKTENSSRSNQSSNPLFGGIAAAVLLLIVGVLDIVTGWTTSVMLLYLVPVGVATWCAGGKLGVAVGFVVALIHIDVDLQSPLSVTTSFWNAGMLFGVILTFVALLAQVRRLRHDATSLRTLSRALGFGAASACVFGGVGFVVDSKALLPASHGGAAEHTVEAKLPAPHELFAVAAHYDSCIHVSRAILLGSRDPRSRSCVLPVKFGELTDKVPQVLYDLDGGAGTSLVLLSKTERLVCRKPTEDFAYHQQRIRPYLQKQKALNDDVLPRLANFANASRRLAQLFEVSSAWPSGVERIDHANVTDWPGTCLSELNKAVAAKDLPQARRWSAELAAAAFSLHDLHRWLALLLDNYLAALDFQQRCEYLFVAADKVVTDYNPVFHLSYLPAGQVTLFGDANFLEVERQAELLFSVPESRLAKSPVYPFATAVAVLPEYRDAYLQMAKALSSANQLVLSQAAQSPYEHAYLVSMLHRAQQADTLDQLADCLRRFDSSHPQGKVSQLMDVLMYRGHSFGDLEWADRFQPPLMEQAARLNGSDVDVFGAACQWASEFCLRTEYGSTLTLRQSMEQKVLDCIRATDMIAALYRDAGRPCIGHVRWSNGDFGHSVAALMEHGAAPGSAILGDAMNLSAKPEYWPDAYFHGHAWPPGMENNAPPETVELYVRGLDNYLWAEGYFIRGANAGTLSTATIPYLEGRDTTSSRKIFAGPYPQ